MMTGKEMVVYKEFVFVYGTLKRDGRAARFLEGQDYVGDFTSVDKFLMFGTSFPMAILSTTDGHRVSGEVFSVNSKVMPDLDAYEGYPSFYNRTKLMFLNERGVGVAAWMYHITDYEQMTFKNRVEPRDDGVLEWTNVTEAA